MPIKERVINPLHVYFLSRVERTVLYGVATFHDTHVSIHPTHKWNGTKLEVDVYTFPCMRPKAEVFRTIEDALAAV